MNKFYLILMPVFLFSCVGEHNSDAQKAEIWEQEASPIENLGDTIPIDIQRSMIFWKGTKMRGAGTHSGEIEIKQGYFIIDNVSMVGGEFIVDMNSIRVTDIPLTDPIPIKRITDHLKSDDFFDAKRFPVSHFKILKVERTSSDSIYISGKLTIKNITKQIGFTALQRENSFTTKFLIDRFQWNIAYEGNWVEKTLVDKEMELRVEIQWE